MIKFVTGNLLESTAECLVNAVNCEGHMGKGLAYQFKQKYPENYKKYKIECQSGALHIGTLHVCKEKDKTIINFPTKFKWREKSKLEYINYGLRELKNTILNLGLKSIAIPQLGCGNGGLNWNDVKKLILNELTDLADELDIFIYESSKNYDINIETISSLTVSHLILMLFKKNLVPFNMTRLQKAGYFFNLFLNKNLFKFSKGEFGPYSQEIVVLSDKIRYFQNLYGITTDEFIEIVKGILISESVDEQLQKYLIYIEKSTKLVNSFKNDTMLDILSIISYIVKKNQELNIDEIIEGTKTWSLEFRNVTEQQVKELFSILEEQKNMF